MKHSVNQIYRSMAVMALAALTYPAMVSAEETHWNAELLGGIYSSEISRLDEQELFGARVGYRFHDHFGMHVNLSARVGELEVQESNATIDW